MPLKDKKVLVLCCQGKFQDHLVERLVQEFFVCAIVRHEYADKSTLLNRAINKLTQPAELVRHIYARLKLAEHDRRAQQYIESTFKTSYKDLSQIPEIFTHDVNEQRVIDFICGHQPDIICVNGTNLLRDNLLEQTKNIPYGIINLHTGLSPYSRGGNCNLYMLLEKRPELVGITVHHIDSGIDSGDIIISAQVDYDQNDNYEIIDAKAFKLGIEAMVEACKQLFSGSTERIKQWEQGKLFLNRTGYSYKPYHRLQVNQLIDKGLIRDYLEHKDQINQNVKTIGNFRQENV